MLGSVVSACILLSLLEEKNAENLVHTVPLDISLVARSGMRWIWRLLGEASLAVLSYYLGRLVSSCVDDAADRCRISLLFLRRRT